MTFNLQPLSGALDRLEDNLQRAGLELLRARAAGAPEAELKALLKRYGIARQRGCARLVWLLDHGELLRWHQGEGPCASGEHPCETGDLDSVSSALTENPSAR